MFFGPKLGTWNAKNPFGPFKVTLSFKWLLRVLKGGWAKMLMSAKITETSYHYISIEKKQTS